MRQERYWRIWCIDMRCKNYVAGLDLAILIIGVISNCCGYPCNPVSIFEDFEWSATRIMFWIERGGGDIWYVGSWLYKAKIFLGATSAPSS